MRPGLTLKIAPFATQRVYVFCIDLRTNSDDFLMQHLLVNFKTETECIYCAVRAEHVFQVNGGL
jgi:hypothetical protein